MISFNNIPTTLRTPGVVAEVDNSRALQGLAENPHKALIIGQKIAAGTVPVEVLTAITSDGLADGFFGPGSMLARMCNTFKLNNPNTELFAIALSNNGGTAASGTIQFSVALSHAGGLVSTDGEIINLMINGTTVDITLESDWSVLDVNSAAQTIINADSTLPVYASTNAASALNLIAVCSGTQGNYLDFRFNYYTGESDPTCFGDSAVITSMAGGATDPDLGDAWGIIDNDQYHYIVQPYIDAANLTEIEDELADRFKPMVDLQGHGFAAVRATLASCTTLGNTRNAPHNTIMGAYDSPTSPEEWAAALGAQAAFNLNQDPARPLHYLKLQGVLAPPSVNRFSQTERNTILYDGIATWVCDTVGNVLIERCITTYQTNALGIIDPSYLDVQTLATLGEIRYQFKARMVNRFIIPRMKLVSDNFPIQAGTNTVSPSVVKQEILALFAELQQAALIEDLDNFGTNLVVERDSEDVNRVNVLLPPDLVNQFRVLAGLIQFIL